MHMNTPKLPVDEANASEDIIATTETKQPTALGAISIFLLEMVKILLLAGITVFVVRHFIFKPFYVSGQSMEPTFFEKEYLIIDQFTYRFREPERGEIIVFRPPVNSDDFYLKRIIGLPGERVRVENGSVIVCSTECQALDETYLGSSIETEGSVRMTLGPDQYFMMGDNRSFSFDSRKFGAVDKDLIVGRIWFRGYPFERIGNFDIPAYPNLSTTTAN
jgi:signal peptidase I